MNTEQLLKDGNALVVDVRTPGEYRGGHVDGSLNIPLDEVARRVDEIKAQNKPVVLCCASGMRSMQATSILTQLGVPNCRHCSS